MEEIFWIIVILSLAAVVYYVVFYFLNKVFEDAEVGMDDTDEFADWP